jgi:tetratricopeptide (TPR) repeat protein
MWLWSSCLLAIMLWALVYFWGIRSTFSKIKRERTELVIQHMAFHGQSETEIQKAIALFPNQPEPLVRHVVMAFDKGDMEEAARRAEALRKRFPRNPVGFKIGANALIQLGKRAEAEALITEALRKMGKIEPLLTCQAYLAQQASNTALAAERFDEICRLFPDLKEGYVGGALVKAEMGRHDEAEALLKCAVEKPLKDVAGHTMIRYARYAHHREDWNEAIRRWKLMCERMPFIIDGYLGQIEALRCSGNLAQAARLLESAEILFPNNSKLDAEIQHLHHRSNCASEAAKEQTQ